MKIAQSTCIKCHGIFPRTEMQQEVIGEHAGTSFGLSKNLKQGSTSRGSFRVYRRNRKVWVCNSCIEEKNKSEGIPILILLAAGLLIGTLIGIFNG